LLRHFFKGRRSSAIEAGLICIQSALIERQMRAEIASGHDCPLGASISRRQSLAKKQQQRGIEKSKLSAAQKRRGVKPAGIRLTGERDLKITIDDEIKKQLGKTRAYQGLVANQRGPEFSVSAGVDGRTSEQLNEHATGLDREFTRIAREKRSTWRGAVRH
jgi:hypothetical protein